MMMGGFTIKGDDNAMAADDAGNAQTTSGSEYGVMYACLRCGTLVSNDELTKLPEIKCICGFRVFTKARPPVTKTVQAI